MKKKNANLIIILLVAALLVFAGHKFLLNKNNQISNNPNPNNSSAANNNSNNNTTPQISMIKGSGNEPGWTIEIENSSANLANHMANIVVDYGEAKYSGYLSKTMQQDYSKGFEYKGQVADMKNITAVKDVVVTFKKQECIDDAGRPHAYNVELKLGKDKTYKGCADA